MDLSFVMIRFVRVIYDGILGSLMRMMLIFIVMNLLCMSIWLLMCLVMNLVKNWLVVIFRMKRDVNVVVVVLFVFCIDIRYDVVYSIEVFLIV